VYSRNVGVAEPPISPVSVYVAKIYAVLLAVALMPRRFNEFGVRALAHAQINAIGYQLFAVFLEGIAKEAVENVCPEAGLLIEFVVADPNYNIVRIYKARFIQHHAWAAPYKSNSFAL